MIGWTRKGRFYGLRRRTAFPNIAALAGAALIGALGCSEKGGGEQRPLSTISPVPKPAAGDLSQIDIGLLIPDVPTNLNSNEPHLAINPVDPQVVAVSQFQTVSLSFDGGQTFTASVFASAPAGYGNAGGDASLAFDSRGRLFMTFLLEIPCTNPMSPITNCKGNGGFGAPDLFVQQIDARRPGTAVASRRLDAAGNDCTAAGANAAQCPVNVTSQLGLGACNDVNPNGRSADRQYLIADMRPACGAPTPARSTRTCSPFTDNLYVIWSDGACGTGAPTGMQVASSSNQGANWTNQALTAGSGDFRQPGIGIGANGDVYAAYHTQVYNSDDSDGASGQIVLYQSATGTAAGFAGNLTTPFPAPTADITRNRQQCQCPGSTCAGTGAACSFSPTTCPGPNCECGAGGTCNPAASCTNTPIPGWRACPRRLQTNGDLTWGSQSPYIVGDSTNPNNVAVFASTDPNRAGTARDNMDVMYVVARNAATAAPTWSAPIAVTPNGAGLPATNQLFPTAIGNTANSCVTLAYYDDRNPTKDAQGNNLLDVFVTVHPNLWATGNWQPEVKISQSTFNPDIGAPDFFSYCGGTPGCVEPAGWRTTSRMGEYFGLVQARGAAWTGSTAFGQRIVFNYSDGLAPTVTPPGSTSVNTCRPTVASLGTATASDPCGMPPLSTPTATVGTLSRGPNTVQWTATDGAANVGTATQTVTVNDTTPPSITAPATVDAPVCDTGTVTVGVPTGSDDCNVTVTFTGQVISRNGVTLSPPINVTNGQVNLGFGTYVVRWTASDGINTSAAVFQTVIVRPRMQAAGNFTVDDNAFVKDANGSGGQILNSATGATHLGVASTSGSITSVASVDLSNNARVTGNVITAGVLNASSTAVVTGTRTQNASVVLPALPALPAFPPPVGPNITVNSGTQTLTPGSYPTVTLNSGATLVMTAGDFFIQNFFINSSVNVRIQVTPNTRVFVQNQFAFRSPFINSSGTLQPILLGFAGATLTVETTFNGTLLAPNGSVTFGIGSGVNYHGAFYAKNIELRNASTLTCDDAVAQPLPGVPSPATCSDGSKDGNETDVDCGGSCGACANGKQCLLSSDCQNGSCVAGICQQPTGQVTATVTVFADWGSGYCADLLVTNRSAQPTRNWSVTVNTGAATIYNSWNGNFPQSTGSVAVTPAFSWNQVIPAGVTNNSVGFCANRTPSNSGALPRIVSASGTF